MNIGRLLISEGFLLEWLRFQHGRVVGATWDYDREALCLVIEHPDMPAMEEGKAFPIVTPAYRQIELLGYKYERVLGELTLK